MSTKSDVLLTHVQNNREYLCVSLPPEITAKALEIAQQTGQHVRIVAETSDRNHIIFVAKDFKDDAWVERLFRKAQKFSEMFAKKQCGLFSFEASSEINASIARLSVSATPIPSCHF